MEGKLAKKHSKLQSCMQRLDEAMSELRKLREEQVAQEAEFSAKWSDACAAKASAEELAAETLKARAAADSLAADAESRIHEASLLADQRVRLQDEEGRLFEQRRNFEARFADGAGLEKARELVSREKKKMQKDREELELFRRRLHNSALGRGPKPQTCGLPQISSPELTKKDDDDWLEIAMDLRRPGRSRSAAALRKAGA